MVTWGTSLTAPPAGVMPTVLQTGNTKRESGQHQQEQQEEQWEQEGRVSVSISGGYLTFSALSITALTVVVTATGNTRTHRQEPLRGQLRHWLVEEACSTVLQRNRRGAGEEEQVRRSRKGGELVRRTR